MSAALDHAGLMDRVYRLQSKFGFYDATRKYYLLGRDPMIEALAVPPGATVLEIGCGTGRNLVMVGNRYPRARLFGVDISREMLGAAEKAIHSAKMTDRTQLAFADAATFDARATFARHSFERIYISYAVSMIPAWERVIDRAIAMLAPGGELHIVDFGDLDGQAPLMKSMLYTWLRWYHVTPRATLFDECRAAAERHGCSQSERRLYGGFTWIARIERPDRMLSAPADLLDKAAAA